MTTPVIGTGPGMTDKQVQDAKDSRYLATPAWTDDTLKSAVQAELDACIDALVPLIEREQDARAARDTLADREHGIATLEGLIAEDRDAERRLLVSDPREAVNARVRANEATAMCAEATTQFIAVKAAVDRHDFDEAERQIAALVEQREYLMRVISNKDVRARLIADDNENREAMARRISHEHLTNLAAVLAFNDPKNLAEAADTTRRAKTKAEHERREAAALKTATAKPKPISTEVAGLTVFGQRVNPVAAGLGSTGGTVR